MDIAIALYKYNGNNKYTKLFLFNTISDNIELVLINYHNNNQFVLIYRIHKPINDICIVTDLKKINLNKIDNNNIKKLEKSLIINVLKLIIKLINLFIIK